jgi:hypothetical protein
MKQHLLDALRVMRRVAIYVGIAILLFFGIPLIVFVTLKHLEPVVARRIPISPPGTE